MRFPSLIACCGLLLVGCGVETSKSIKVQTNTPGGPDDVSASSTDTTAAETLDTPETTEHDNAAATEVAPAAEPVVVATETEIVEAAPGVGAAGRGLDGSEGIYVTPAKTLFGVREKLVFEVQIPAAMRLHEANNGQAPKTHDEFMEKIVQANQIQLPQLPTGSSYKHDPETQQLMVKRPRR